MCRSAGLCTGTAAQLLFLPFLSLFLRCRDSEVVFPTWICFHYTLTELLRSLSSSLPSQSPSNTASFVISFSLFFRYLASPKYCPCLRLCHIPPPSPPASPATQPHSAGLLGLLGLLLVDPAHSHRFFPCFSGAQHSSKVSVHFGVFISVPKISAVARSSVCTSCVSGVPVIFSASGRALDCFLVADCQTKNF